MQNGIEGEEPLSGEAGGRELIDSAPSLPLLFTGQTRQVSTSLTRTKVHLVPSKKRWVKGKRMGPKAA